MKNTNAKKNRKKSKAAFWITIICSIVVFIVSSVAYAHTQQGWLVWLGIADMVLFAVGLISFSFIVWLWDIKDLMTEYKEKDNLLSGGLAFVSIFGLVILMLYGLSELPFVAEGKELMQTMSSLFVAAMPAFIGLLGVQFSVAIQERNRKQDLRLGAKPFFKVQCCKVAAIPDENGHTCHAMKIKVNITNISQSIGIPAKVISCDSENCVVELPYTPLANKDVFEKEVEVTSEHPYGDKVHIAIIYKDVYENLYEMKITFIQHSKFDMSETEVLSDGLLANECTK